MNLSASTGESIDDPTPDQIRQVLTCLLAGEDSFAVLGRSEQFYIEACGCAEDGFMLEYREGSDQRHLRATDYGLPLDKVVGAFREYAEGDIRFRDGIGWEPAFASLSEDEVLEGAQLGDDASERPQAPDGDTSEQQLNPDEATEDQPSTDEDAFEDQQANEQEAFTEQPSSRMQQDLPDMSTAIRPTAGCLLAVVPLIAVLVAVAGMALLG